MFCRKLEQEQKCQMSNSIKSTQEQQQQQKKEANDDEKRFYFLILHLRETKT